MQFLLQKATTFSSAMSIKDPKVENLGIPTRALSGCALFIPASFVFLLLLLPLAFPVRLQRTAGRSPGEVDWCSFGKSWDLNHAGLVRVFIVWPLTSGYGGAEMMLCAPERNADNGRIAVGAKKRGR